MTYGDTLHRVRSNWDSGALNADINDIVLGMSSTEFTTLPVIVAPDYLPIVLDKDEQFGAPEIVWVTGHAAGHDTVTIVRGKEGTTARTHVTTTKWLHGLTAHDMMDMGERVVRKAVVSNSQPVAPMVGDVWVKPSTP